MKSIITAIKQNSALENLNATTLWLAFTITIFMLFKVLSLANVGIDLTDEGYYFNWISNPWLYQYYASQFGYIYHPIYKALGNSIIHLRQANMLISFGLSWLLSYFVLKQTLQNTSKSVLVIASASLSLPALYILMITGRWVPSPSYNSLNFQGCLIVALGFVFSANKYSIYRFIPSLLIGVGGWLVFMAKPSSALLLAIVAVIYFIPTFKNDWRVLIGAAVVSIVLLLLSAIAIDGSVLQFIKRYQGGLLLMSNMASGHGLENLFKLDLFKVSIFFKLKLVLLTGFLFLGFKLAHNKNETIKTATATILNITLVIIFLLYTVPTSQNTEIVRYHTLIITAIIFASLLYFVFCQRSKNTNSNKLILLFLIMPYMFAAGTGNNYWHTGAGASVFWVLAAILILARTIPNLQTLNKQALSLSTLSVVVSFVVSVSVQGVFDSMQSPYRQTDAILKQTATYLDPHSQQTLIVSNDTAKYLKTVGAVAANANFKPQTPMIDLTGHHPGTLYFMQAKSIGQAWTIGAYAGSYPLASLALYQANCEEIANAWLLMEKDGRRKISSKMLESHGVHVTKATYTKVAKFNTQRVDDFGGSNPLHPDAVYEQFLLKPVDVENQTNACLAYRKAHTSPFEHL